VPRRLSFRDRFFTPKVSRAVTSPSAIIATGATAALGVLVFSNPLGLLLGAVGYAARVAIAIPRNPSGREIDPFAVNPPWREFVGDALSAQRRYGEATRTMRPGPLHDRLIEIGDRLDTGVDEVWHIAQRGQVLADGRKRLQPEQAQRELAQLVAENPRPEPGSPIEQTAQSLQAQIATAQRMDAVIKGTADRLRLMDARLDEMVTRTVELSTQADTADDARGLGSDVDGLVSEMESLRQALEDTSGTSPTLPPSPTGATPSTDRPAAQPLPPPPATGQA